MGKYNSLWKYIAAQRTDSVKLTFAEIEQIAHVELDHSFLTCKRSFYRMAGKSVKFP